MTTEAYADCVKTLETAAEQLQSNIDRTLAWVESNTESLQKLKVVYLAGKLQSAAIAAEGALKLMETLLILPKGTTLRNTCMVPAAPSIPV